MKNYTFHLFAFVCLTALLTGCATQENQPIEPAQSFVNPPIPALDPGFESFTIQGNGEQEVLTESGSIIRIPAGAFVTASGLAISGEIALHYREFQDILSIYLAGIPMEYGGGNFTTAGSFELRAEQGDSTLQLANGKTIEVLMATENGEPGYDFFKLDESTGQWDSLGTGNAFANKEKTALEQKIKRMKNKASRYFVMDYLAVLDVMYNHRLDQANKSEVTRKTRAYDLGWAGIKSYQSLKIDGKWEFAPFMVWENMQRKHIPAWTTDRLGYLEHVEARNFVLHVYNQDSTRHFTAPVQAVMPLDKLFALDPGMWNKEKEQAMALIRAEEARWRKMNSFYRSFELQEMGIHNWDRVLKNSGEPIFVEADFNFNENIDLNMHDLEAVYFSADGKSMIKLPEESWGRMTIVSEKGGKLFVLLPGDKPALYTAEQYQAIPRGELKKMEKPAFTFDMTTTGKPIASAEELRKMLEI
ncbi:MAG: hypothetical protein R2792_10825 [Saprospiraceae bacterium]